MFSWILGTKNVFTSKEGPLRYYGITTAGSGLDGRWGTAPVKHDVFRWGGWRGWGGVGMWGTCQFPAAVLPVFVLLCVLCWCLPAETLWQEPEGWWKFPRRKILKLRKFSSTNLICFVNREEDLYYLIFLTGFKNGWYMFIVNNASNNRKLKVKITQFLTQEMYLIFF